MEENKVEKICSSIVRGIENIFNLLWLIWLIVCIGLAIWLPIIFVPVLCISVMTRSRIKAGKFVEGNLIWSFYFVIAYIALVYSIWTCGLLGVMYMVAILFLEWLMKY